MQFITFGLETLTPTFLSGADQGTVELRSASFRGILRWWWRARQNENSLHTLRETEGALFGSTDIGTRSAIRIFTNARELKVIPVGSPAPKSGVCYEYVRQGRSGTTDVLPYLAYGPVRLLTTQERETARARHDVRFLDDRGQPKRGALFIRPAIAPGCGFDLTLSWMEGRITDRQIAELVRTMAGLVMLGGIGTRSRKGFGALAGQIKDASTAELKSQSQQVWEEEVRNLQGNGSPLSGPVPAFPKLENRVVLMSSPKEYWQHALGQIGLCFKEYRPKKERRWIAGEADPRRASSILLTVVREKTKYRGVMTLLPCLKNGGTSGEDQMRRFTEEFARWQIL